MVRHGRTDCNVLGKLQGRTDTRLNKSGILQAEKCSEFLNLFMGCNYNKPLKKGKTNSSDYKYLEERDYGDLKEYYYKKERQRWS